MGLVALTEAINYEQGGCTGGAKGCTDATGTAGWAGGANPWHVGSIREVAAVTCLAVGAGPFMGHAGIAVCSYCVTGSAVGITKLREITTFALAVSSVWAASFHLCLQNKFAIALGTVCVDAAAGAYQVLACSASCGAQQA